jgi:hypothetical protein
MQFDRVKIRRRVLSCEKFLKNGANWWHFGSIFLLTSCLNVLGLASNYSILYNAGGSGRGY